MGGLNPKHRRQKNNRESIIFLGMAKDQSPQSFDPDEAGDPIRRLRQLLDERSIAAADPALLAEAILEIDRRLQAVERWQEEENQRASE